MTKRLSIAKVDRLAKAYEAIFDPTKDWSYREAKALDDVKRALTILYEVAYRAEKDA